MVLNTLCMWSIKCLPQIHQTLLWSHATRFVKIQFLCVQKNSGSSFLLMLTPAARHVLESPIMWCKTTALPIGLSVQNANGENSLQFGAPHVFVVRFYIAFHFHCRRLTTMLPCLFVPLTLPLNDEPWREGHMRTACRSSHIHLRLKPKIRQIRFSRRLQALSWDDNVFQRIKVSLSPQTDDSRECKKGLSSDRFGIYLSHSALSQQHPIILTLRTQNCEQHDCTSHGSIGAAAEEVTKDSDNSSWRATHTVCLDQLFGWRTSWWVLVAFIKRI